MSPPVRRRGLKHAGGRGAFRLLGVASRAEAWIETGWTWPRPSVRKQSPPVRRRGLKQTIRPTSNKVFKSPPVRRRGLKPFANTPESSPLKVASRAEAWIETIKRRYRLERMLASPPVRRRGLKLAERGSCGQQEHQSPPVRRRGLKHIVTPQGVTYSRVASRAEAWIETTGTQPVTQPGPRRLPCGGVD